MYKTVSDKQMGLVYLFSVTHLDVPLTATAVSRQLKQSCEIKVPRGISTYCFCYLWVCVLQRQGRDNMVNTLYLLCIIISIELGIAIKWGKVREKTRHTTRPSQMSMFWKDLITHWCRKNVLNSSYARGCSFDWFFFRRCSISKGKFTCT